MAGMISRSALVLTRRAPLLASTRGAKMMADPMEHATGIERKELEAIAAGNDDPFSMKGLKRGEATKANPQLIPSFHDQRLIGCICHEDAFYVNYMWLYKGEQRRCECGHWFKLTEAKDPFEFLKGKKF